MLIAPYQHALFTFPVLEKHVHFLLDMNSPWTNVSAAFELAPGKPWWDLVYPGTGDVCVLSADFLRRHSARVSMNYRTGKAKLVLYMNFKQKVPGGEDLEEEEGLEVI